MCQEKTEKFLPRFREKHGDRYDYSKVDVLYSHVNIEIICRVHGSFFQTPNNHAVGKGCRKCATDAASKRYSFTLDQFITKAHGVHNYRFDYSQSEYRGYEIPITIRCIKHDHIFKQTPHRHLTSLNGCPLCVDECRNIDKKHDREMFIKLATEIHGYKYNYSEVDYKTSKIKVKIICPEHGAFWLKPNSHITSKAGCRKCADAKNAASLLVPFEEFVKRARKTHGELFDYSNIGYLGLHKRATVICKTHGEFKVNAGAHTRGVGCNKCSGSMGEKLIAIVLEELNITYHREWRVPNTPYLHRYDFYLPEYKILIEYQGKQHYEVVPFFGGFNGFIETIERDVFKLELAKEIAMDVILFPFWELKKGPIKFKRHVKKRIRQAIKREFAEGIMYA